MVIRVFTIESSLNIILGNYILSAWLCINLLKYIKRKTALNSYKH